MELLGFSTEKINITHKFMHTCSLALFPNCFFKHLGTRLVSWGNWLGTRLYYPRSQAPPSFPSLAVQKRISDGKLGEAWEQG